MRCLGYVRVSTGQQKDSGLGLEAQRRAIAAETERRGWDVLWIEDAGYSGSTLDRPGITEALRLLAKREVSALVVAKQDRVSRSVLDFAQLIELAHKQRWALVMLDTGVDTTTPGGEFMAHVVAATAQYERRLIGQRTRDAMAEARARGTRISRWTTDPGVVERIRSERAGGASYAAIAAGLNTDGVPTPGGGREWRKNGVARILARCAQAQEAN